MSSGHGAGVIPVRGSLSAEAEGPSILRNHAFNLSLAFIFFIPWEGVELPGIGAVAKYVGFLAAALWWANVLRVGHLRAPGVFQVSFFALGLWSALSALWSGNPGATLDRALTWAQLLVFVMMVWDLYTTRSAVLEGLQAYVLGAYVAVGSALANYLAGEAFYTNFNRFSSGDTNPDGFGFILALGMPVAWYLASSSKSVTKTGRALRLANFAYIPTAFLGIFLSGTRTALIATIPAMAFGLPSLMRLRAAARIGVLVVLAAAVGGVVYQVQSFKSFQRFGTTTSELTEGDLNYRTKNWLEGLRTFSKHPLIGIGSNMYRSQNSLGKVAHNSYLSVLVEVGLVGLALFGATLMYALLQALRQPGWDRSFWLAQLAVWSIGAFTLTWEHRKSTWLFLSLLVASATLEREGDRAPEPKESVRTRP